MSQEAVIEVTNLWKIFGARAEEAMQAFRRSEGECAIRPGDNPRACAMIEIPLQYLDAGGFSKSTGFCRDDGCAPAK